MSTTEPGIECGSSWFTIDGSRRRNACFVCSLNEAFRRVGIEADARMLDRIFDVRKGDEFIDLNRFVRMYNPRTKKWDEVLNWSTNPVQDAIFAILVHYNVNLHVYASNIVNLTDGPVFYDEPVLRQVVPVEGALATLTIVNINNVHWKALEDPAESNLRFALALHNKINHRQDPKVINRMVREQNGARFGVP